MEQGGWYEKRAAAAALAEPRLLKEPEQVKKVMQILDRITASMESTDHPKDEAFSVLQRAMGYCWSVAVVALPEGGKAMIEKWLNSKNKNIRWMMKENLKKNRLVRMDRDWVRTCTSRLEQAS